jgi:hypothetical protein
MEAYLCMKCLIAVTKLSSAQGPPGWPTTLCHRMFGLYLIVEKWPEAHDTLV